MAVDSYEYDVLVVGTGNAANAAALAALDQKARVGILEKAPKPQRGGNSTLTGHMRFVFNGLEDLRPMVKSMSDDQLRALLERLPHRTEAEIWDEFMHVTNNQSDQDMLQVHVTESLKTVHWLASKGHDWVPTLVGGVSDNILSMNGGGFGLQQRNFTFLEAGGAKFHYEASALELIQDKSGQVVGVRAQTPTGYQTFRAKATVLACGGFEANPEMRARYLGPGWDMIRTRGVPFNTGDGLRMALNIGAMPHGSWSTCHASAQDFNMPLFTVPLSQAVGSGGSSTSRYMYPYSIMVNTNGTRFVDEGEDLRGNTYAKVGRMILEQPGGVAFQIMDAKVRRMNLYTANYNEKASHAQADTLEKLAAELGINVSNFVKTVNEFNAAIQPGTFNPDKLRLDGKGTAGIYPAKSNYALSVEEPPFEGWPVRCGITFTFGGLRIDPKTGQVQHVAGRPIAGLYAAGEMIGGLFVGNYPSGSGMMAGATFGRIAGASAGKSSLGH